MLKKTIRTSLLLGCVSASLVLSGYGQSTTPPSTGSRSPQTTTTHDNDHNTRSESASPLAQAVEMNAAEVEAGKMASTKAQNPEVKEFANMMVKDHTDALMKLRALPGGSSVSATPNAKHKQTADKLSKLTGADFDRQYMTAMVSDHQQAVKFFEQQSGPGKSATSPANPDLTRVSQELLPTVRQHLQMAEQIQKDLRGTGKSSQSSRTNSSASPSSTTNPGSRTSPNPTNRPTSTEPGR